MIINIKKGKVITSAAFEHKEGKLPALIINTKDRWVHPSHTESATTWLRICYKYSTYVELLAENQDDELTLNRLRFENHCKDQKVILFIPDELM